MLYDEATNHKPGQWVVHSMDRNATAHFIDLVGKEKKYGIDLSFYRFGCMDKYFGPMDNAHKDAPKCEKCKIAFIVWTL